MLSRNILFLLNIFKLLATKWPHFLKGKSVIVSNNILALQFQKSSILLRLIFEVGVLGFLARPGGGSQRSAQF